MGDKIFVHI